MEGFFEYISRDDKNSPLDFFSWHCYTPDPKEVGEHARFVDTQLKKYGFGDTESMLAEWNYALDRNLEDVKKRKNHFGASMVMASIIEIQKSPVDGGMYYDAEISVVFDREITVQEILETNEDITNLYKMDFMLSDDRKTLGFNMKPYEVAYIDVDF